MATEPLTGAIDSPAEAGADAGAEAAALGAVEAGADAAALGAVEAAAVGAAEGAVVAPLLPHAATVRMAAMLRMLSRFRLTDIEQNPPSGSARNRSEPGFRCQASASVERLNSPFRPC